MTDEPNPEPTPNEDTAPDSDYLLATLISLCNGIRDFTMSITVTVSGTTITGTLIGGHEYYTLLADGLDQAQGAGAEGFAAAMSPRLRELAEDYGSDEAEDLPVGFVHIKDARIVGDAGFIPTSGGLLWRGRIEHVSGWTLGTLSEG